MGIGKAKMQATTECNGCWLGHIQKPLLPSSSYAEEELIKRSPFLLLKVVRMVDDDRTDKHLIQISLDCDYKPSTTVVVFLQEPGGDLVILPTEPMPKRIEIYGDDGSKHSRSVPTLSEKEIVDEETEEKKLIREKMNRQFPYANVAIGETVSYLVYIVNNEAIEGKFHAVVNNLSPHHHLTVLVARQFSCEWYVTQDLKFETSTDGKWDGYSEYGGSPTDQNNRDWLLYNLHYLLTVKQPTRCWISVDKHEDDFPIGIVVLTRLAEEEANYDITGVESRTVAHSMFPLSEKKGRGKYLSSVYYNISRGIKMLIGSNHDQFHLLHICSH